jgi:hypothetical protein
MNTLVPDIFLDASKQELFNKQGFLVCDFLTLEEVKYLSDLFHQWHPVLPQSRFMSDSYSPDLSMKRKTSEQITKVFLPHFQQLFKDFTPFGSSFLYKTPGKESSLAPHQDWTIVDETRALALNVWVPLCDTNEHNGTLQILPGSHRHILPLRAPTLPFFFSGSEDLLMPYFIPLVVKAGQAVILNQRLVHYSAPNHSDSVRIAITSGVKTKGAPMVFYYKDPEKPPDLLARFRQEDDFLISFRNFYEDIRKRPYLGEFIEEITYSLPRYEGEALTTLLDKMYTSAGYELKKNIPEGKSSIWSRLKSLIKVGA